MSQESKEENGFPDAEPHSESQLSLAIEASASGLIMNDDQGKNPLVNSQAENYFGNTVVPLELKSQSPITTLCDDMSATIDQSQGSIGSRSENIGEPVDLAEIYSRYGDGGQKLLRLFLADASADLANLDKAFRRENGQDFAQTVHGLKGICGAVFAVKMRTTCVDMENAAREGDWATISAMLQRLEKEQVEVQEFLKWQWAKATE